MNKSELFAPANLVQYQNQAIVSQRILENASGGITVFAFDKDQRFSEHSAPFDATIFILEGKAEIKIAGISHHLSSNEMIIMPANVPHAVYASEQFKMLLIMVKGS